MLVTRLPPPGDRPRLACRAAGLDALAAARCAVRLAGTLAEGAGRDTLLSVVEEQLELARWAVERLD